MKVTSVAHTGGYCEDCIFYTIIGKRVCSPVRGVLSKSWYNCYSPSVFNNIKGDVLYARGIIIFL